MKVFLVAALLPLLVCQKTDGQSISRQNTQTSIKLPVQGSSCTSGKSYGQKWTVDPFDLKVFVQNNGQFDNEVQATTDDKVLFQAQLGQMDAYFTAHGVIYRYDEYPKANAARGNVDPDMVPYEKPVTHYLKAFWKGSNPDVIIVGENEQSYYNSYPLSTDKSVKANVFKKLVYKDIYPGIDIEYLFPKNKSGIKYTIIVHPGADVSKVKLLYTGAKEIKVNPKNGNVVVMTDGMGNFIDHAPVSYYNENKKSVESGYTIKNNEESFYTKATDGTKTMMIDPWTTDPKLNSTSGYDVAYDLDYDNAGNIYVYGSYNPYRLVKLNSAGVIQWQFIATIFKGVWHYYGDFACDKVPGTCYLTEGCYNVTGARILKVNNAGTLLSTFPGDPSMREMWRAVYNSCDRTIVIGGGGTNTGPYNAFVLDTTLTKLYAVNTTGATGCCHDICLTAIDPTGASCYMATARSASSSSYDNIILKTPLPSLSPTTWTSNDNYTFQEASSPTYVGPGSGTANGMNGMAASPNWLYLYDGAVLKRFNKATGAFVTSVTLGATSFTWGGLDVDACDNVYAGYQSTVHVYNSALSLTTTIPQNNTTYDVVLGNNYKFLYTCGIGFVTSDTLAGTPVKITITRTDANCSLCNGTATATLDVCGTPTIPSSYLWSNGQTTSTATGLCAGTYTITMATGCGVTYQDTVIIKKSGSASFTITRSSTASLCTSSNGTATVTVSGGTTPYTYLWSTGGTTSSISGLSSGTYCVTITDATGCNDTACVNVPNAGGLTGTITPIKNITCFGANNGSLTSVPSGGTTPYTYSWSSGQSTSTITGLSAGSYTVTVTDANGCTTSDIATIKEPPQLRDSIASFTNPPCSGNTGSATVGVKGGTGIYTYAWTPGGQTTSTVTGLTSGSYTVNITDSNGCTNSASVTIVSPTPVTVTTTTSSSSCLGNTGSATATPSGGTGGTYTYAWTPTGGTNATASGLSSGSYTITVTDSNGCSGSATASIGNIGGEKDTIVDVVNVKCYKGATGGATDSAFGGTLPYTYSWAPTGQTTSTITGLTAGSYTVTTTDNKGCISTAVITITQPTQLRDSIANFTNVKCFGNNIGSATVGVKGGTTPYTYTWTPTGGTAATASGLSGGTYTVNITDANGCTGSASVVITAPPAMKLTAAGFPPTCNGGSNGQATVIPSGGTTPYTYSWSSTPVQTNANASNLTAGTYTITVTDANGCSIDTTVTITQPAAIVVAFTADTLSGCYPLCFDFKDGSSDPNSTINKWNWSFGDGGTDTNQNPRHCYLNAGVYSVTLTVTDKNGCTGTLTTNNMITVYAHPAANFTFSPQPTTIYEPNITFTDKSTDPYGIVSWLWKFNDPGSDSVSTQENPSHAFNDTGMFCPELIVTNKYGCMDSINECLVISPQYTLFIPDAFSPNGDGLNDIFMPKGQYVYDYNMYIFDRWGLMIFHSTSLDKGWDGSLGGNICQEDTYVYLITCTDNLGKQHSYIGKVTLLK